MPTPIVFLDTPTGAVVVGTVDLAQIADDLACEKLRRRIEQRYATPEVILRYPLGAGFRFNGPRHLWRWAVDPVVDALPSIPFDDELGSQAA